MCFSLSEYTYGRVARPNFIKDQTGAHLEYSEVNVLKSLKGGLHEGVFWPPTKCFYILQVNSLTCVLYPGIPLLAHNNGCFRARIP